MIDMQAVQSNNIRAFGYDAASSALYITFVAGPTYRYEGVGQGVYNKLLDALNAKKSVGAVFWSDINGKYIYQRLYG